jgi:thiol-disulfide isomerase/thioredoxin
MKKHSIILSLVILTGFVGTFLDSADALPADYKLVGLDGESANSQLNSLKKDYRLVMFWGLWCGICKKKLRKDLPEMQKTTNIDVVTINMDDPDMLENVVHYVEKKGKITVPVLREASGTVAKKMGISISPYWALYKKVPQSQQQGSAKGFQWKLVKAAGGFKKKQILELSGNAKTASFKKAKG